MSDGGKNLRDITFPIKDATLSISQDKVNKLVTALYMVTDIISDSEPLRVGLRTHGVELVSDINSIKIFALKDRIDKAYGRVVSILSFLEIGHTLGMVSEMNFSILKKEFLVIKASIEGLKLNLYPPDSNISIAHFLLEETKEESSLSTKYKQQTRLGVQTGGDLMKALSDKVSSLAGNKISSKDKELHEISKKERRFEIVRVLKDSLKNDNSKGLTISDIRNLSDSKALLSCSEKTLQRELVSMVNDEVLHKEGSKRWSKYFLKSNI